MPFENINKPAWAPAETAVLRQLYPNAPQAEVQAALPERSWDAIKRMGTLLQVRRAAVWSNAAVATLREFLPTHGKSYVARLLGKSPSTVHHKATRLGIANPGHRRRVLPPERAREPRQKRVAPVPAPAPAPAEKRVSGGSKRAFTPNLNAQIAKRRKSEEVVVLITAADIRRLPINDAGRRAYTLGGVRGYQQYQQQLTA